MRMGGVVLRERSTDWGYRSEHKKKFASVLDGIRRDKFHAFLGDEWPFRFPYLSINYPHFAHEMFMFNDY